MKPLAVAKESMPSRSMMVFSILESAKFVPEMLAPVRLASLRLHWEKVTLPKLAFWKFTFCKSQNEKRAWDKSAVSKILVVKLHFFLSFLLPDLNW